MVEEARLESVYTGNRIEGSNPSVSAQEIERPLRLISEGLFTSVPAEANDEGVLLQMIQ